VVQVTKTVFWFAVVLCRKWQRENAGNTDMLDADAAGLTDKERLELAK